MRKTSWGVMAVALVTVIGLLCGPVLAQTKPPELTFPDGAQGKVTFSHEKHITDGKLKCTDCHTKIFKMTKGQRSKITMKEIQEGKACGVCHNGTKVFGATAPDSCAKCHKKS